MHLLSRLFTGCILALAFLLSSPLSAESSNKMGTGREALQTCDGEAFADKVFCIGFLRGSVSAHIISGLISLTPARKGAVACLPENSTSEDWLSIYVGWLKASPSDLNVEAGALFLGALKNAYPCKVK